MLSFISSSDFVSKSVDSIESTIKTRVEKKMHLANDIIYSMMRLSAGAFSSRIRSYFFPSVKFQSHTVYPLPSNLCYSYVQKQKINQTKKRVYVEYPLSCLSESIDSK